VITVLCNELRNDHLILILFLSILSTKHIPDKQTDHKNELSYPKWKRLKNEDNTYKIENVYK
jgi:hypothetical protein